MRRSWRRPLGYALLLFTLAGHAACGGDADDAAALSLPGIGAAAPPAPLPVSLAAEAAWTQAAQRAGGSAEAQRLSVDFRYDSVPAPRWRLVFADRLDADWLGSAGGAQQINTLKQAYVSWQPQSNLLLDAGRINARQGVAFGYNPTDFLRSDALRAVDSLDPMSLRDNRLGTVMARSESLWDGGAFTALFAPRLTPAPTAGPPMPGPFAADWAATNSQTRWLLKATQQLAAGLAPEWLLFGKAGAAPQLGVNLTTVIGSSTVAFLEASGGRNRSLWARTLAVAADEPVRARMAAGFSYSTRNKLALTLEYEYDGAALSRAGWAAARRADPGAYGRYREFVAAQQELPTQHAGFAYAAWQDVLVKHLDLAAFVRVDLIDHSRLPWAELRYHWARLDAALRWQDYVGGATSDFGAAASRQTWQALLDYYL